MRYMLDSNVISDLVHHPHGKIRNHIKKAGEKHFCTSAIVASEIRFGAEKKGSSRFSQSVELILNALKILPFDNPATFKYAEIRTFLEQSGQPIGANDTLIAAHALSLGLILVTTNQREFKRVPGLKTENWL